MKLLKRIVEFIFIFILPLVIIFIGCDYKKSYSYNNEHITEEIKTVVFDSPFSEYDGLKYTNSFEYFQPLNSMVIDGIFTEETELLSITLTYNAPFQVKFGFTEPQTNIYIKEANTNTITYSSAIFSRSYDYYTIRIYALAGEYDNYEIQPYALNITELVYDKSYSYTDSEINNLVEFLNIDYHSTGNSNTEVITAQSSEILSNYYVINYSFYGQVKNFIFELFDIDDSSFISNVIFTYLSFIIIMLILWYSLYVPIDMLFGFLLRRLSYYK